jgi:putative flippase GtrA
LSTPGQLGRFAAVGLASNAVLYALYLGLTAAGIGHKAAVTLLYCLGGMQGFALNRRWTFGHGGGRGAMARFWLVYVSAYLLNLALLALLVDGADLPHRSVQAALIAVIAAVTFVLHKMWVFRP